MKLIWYGHSCFKLESNDGSVVFDPYERGTVPGCNMPLLEADMVLSSHKHFDHYCPEAVKISNSTPAFEIHRIPCFHDDCRGAKRSRNYISVVEAEGLRVAHLGDLGHLLSEEQLEKLGKIDLLLIPVGGTYTIDAAKAAELTKAVAAPITVPMHYRGEGFGFDNIGTVDEYLRFFDGFRSTAGAELEIEIPESPVIMLFSQMAE